MNLCDFFFSHLLFAPSPAPYGRSHQEANWELDDGNWSAMQVGDWLAVNEQTMRLDERRQVESTERLSAGECGAIWKQP